MTYVRTAKALAFVSTLVAGQQALVQPAFAEQHGKASWYALHSRTACGQRMNPNAMIAAHRSHPCGTKIRVTNTGNGRSVVLTVVDRGPFIRGRIVDVSRAAAQQLGFMGAGVASVAVTPLGSGASVINEEVDMADATPGRTTTAPAANGALTPFDPRLIRTQ